MEFPFNVSWILRALLLLCVPMFMSACSLDSQGTCGTEDNPGVIICGVDKKELRYISVGNAYRFEGKCTDSSTGLATILTYEVSGKWNKNTKKFLEVVETKPGPGITAIQDNNIVITGLSLLDPWMNPLIPVGIEAIAGDPYAIANGLCINSLPSGYNHIPFSRNVIIHAMSPMDLAIMKLEADNMAKESDSPPSPPSTPPPPPEACPQDMLTAPPQIEMPTHGMVYSGVTNGIMIFFRSECGAPYVDYNYDFPLKSKYEAYFEWFSEGAWVKYGGVSFHMNPDTSTGGSSGFEEVVIPLNWTGMWRVRGNKYTTLKQNDTAVASNDSDWVIFWIGEPKVILANIDTSMIKKLSSTVSQGLIDNMNKTWKAGRAKPIVATKGQPTIASMGEGYKVKLRTKPSPIKIIAGRGSTRKVVADVSIVDFKITNKPIPGTYANFEITLRNKGSGVIGPGEYTIALACEQMPNDKSCGYRIGSILTPQLDPGEVWTRKMDMAIRTNDVGAYTVSASVYSPAISEALKKSVSFTAPRQKIKTIPGKFQNKIRVK